MDLDHLCHVLSLSGRSAAGVAIGAAFAFEKIAREAIQHPTLGTADLAQATSLYVSIRGGVGNLQLSAIRAVINSIRAQAPNVTSFVFDSSVEQSLGENMELLIVAAGLPPERESMAGQNLAIMFSVTELALERQMVLASLFERVGLKNFPESIFQIGKFLRQPGRK